MRETDESSALSGEATKLNVLRRGADAIFYLKNIKEKK